MTKHMLALVLLILGLMGCGSSGPRQPNMAVVPSGQGWFCSVGLKGPNECFREEDPCKVAAYERVKQGGQEVEGATVACLAATTATCVTYKKHGKDTVTCLSEYQGCREFREAFAHQASEISTVSVCKDMPSSKPPEPAQGPITSGGATFTIDQACTTSLAFMTDLGALLESNKDNCEAMGTAFEKFIPTYQAYFGWAKAAFNDPATKKAYADKCYAAVAQTTKKVMPQFKNLDPCLSNPKVKAAVDALPH